MLRRTWLSWEKQANVLRGCQSANGLRTTSRRGQVGLRWAFGSPSTTTLLACCRMRYSHCIHPTPHVHVSLSGVASCKHFRCSGIVAAAQRCQLNGMPSMIHLTQAQNTQTLGWDFVSLGRERRRNALLSTKATTLSLPEWKTPNSTRPVGKPFASCRKS